MANIPNVQMSQELRTELTRRGLHHQFFVNLQQAERYLRRDGNPPVFAFTVWDNKFRTLISLKATRMPHDVFAIDYGKAVQVPPHINPR
ncbi:hypothetical protein [Myxococcus phage Mx1]|nr:hypothetical protein [Myxococcus phage Mx1]